MNSYPLFSRQKFIWPPLTASQCAIQQAIAFQWIEPRPLKPFQRPPTARTRQKGNQSVVEEFLRSNAPRFRHEGSFGLASPCYFWLPWLRLEYFIPPLLLTISFPRWIKDASRDPSSLGWPRTREFTHAVKHFMLTYTYTHTYVHIHTSKLSYPLLLREEDLSGGKLPRQRGKWLSNISAFRTRQLRASISSMRALRATPLVPMSRIEFVLYFETSLLNSNPMGNRERTGRDFHSEGVT